MHKTTILMLLLSCVAANAQPIERLKEDQHAFREKCWPTLKAQGWIFITDASTSSSNESEMD